VRPVSLTKGLRRQVLVSGVLTALLGGSSFLVAARSSRAGSILRTDATAYFLYSRSLLLDGNSDVTNEYWELERRFPPGEVNLMDGVRAFAEVRAEDGRVLLPWPVGMGVLYVPFYTVGYAVEWIAAKASKREPDSYGLVPQLAFASGSLFFGLVGFWMTWLSCARLAGRQAAWLGTLSVILAGPAAFYVFFHPGMAHAASFGLVAVLAYLWLERRVESWGGLAVAALVQGLLSTLRYQNVLFGLLLLDSLITKPTRSLRGLALRSMVVAASFVVGFLPQIAHLLASRGPALDGTYQGTEGLLVLGRHHVFFRSPFFWDVLFSCQHGAFYWAPVLGLASVGAVVVAISHRWARWSLLTILSHVYLIGTLAEHEIAWSGGSSFGMRYLTECTPLFALGLASLLALVKQPVRFWAIGAGLSLLVLFNACLILAFGMHTISTTKCVRYGEMAAGILAAFGRLFGGG
jgi:hypothetical protein